MPHKQSKQNYIARMELNRQNKLASGLLSERFPEVSDIVIHMTYYQKGVNPILMLRTVHVLPVDPAYFHMECAIKECIDGDFDLTAIIAHMVKTRKKIEKGKLSCSGKTDSLPSDHASIAYEIGIRYVKKSR
ncbi:MAG: hypothetical protein ABSA46_14560 [Thermodesulfovibrionales bacterium]